METTIALLLFFGFLVGSTLLILICGYQFREDERNNGASERAGIDALAGPHFFASPEGAASAPAAVDQAAVASVALYLQEEMALAQEFVDEPSAERLHEHQKWELLKGDTLSDSMEEHLQLEQAAVEAFVSNPSVERLFGRIQRQIAFC